MKKITGSLLIALTILLTSAFTGLAATITSAGSGNWNSTTANAPWPSGTVPMSADDVIIRPSDSITVTNSQACNSLILSNSATAGPTLTITSAGSLNVGSGTGTVTIGLALASVTTANTTLLDVAGTLSCGNVSMAARRPTNRNADAILRVSNAGAVVTVTGNISQDRDTAGGGLTCDVNFTAGGTLKLTGNVSQVTSGGTVTTVSGSTVEYNGTAQTVFPAIYHHLTLSNSGAKTMASVTTINGNLSVSGTAAATNAAALVIGGSLDVGSGATFAAAGFNITVTNSTSVSGTLLHTSATGTKTHIGLVTVNSGGVWNNTGNAAINFRGGLTHNGITFTAGSGVQTFNTNSQTIGGASAISIPSITVTTVNLTNTGTLTVTTALAGTGALVNSASGTLNVNFSGAMGITTLTATAPGNTVNYSFAGAQTAKATSYDNLTLSGSGAKTTTSITVSNTLSMQGTATASATPTYGAAATLEYAGSSAQTTGAELASTIPNLKINNASDVNVNSSATVSGTLTLTSGKVNTSANVLGIGTAGSISGASSTRYINGNLLKAYSSGSGQSFTYPIGDTNYTPVALANLSLSSGGDLTAKTTGGDHPGSSTNSLDSTRSVNRYWTFTTGGGIAVSTYDATFDFINPADVDSGADTDQFVIRRFNGTQWFASATSARTSTSTTATNFTGFSDFAIGQPLLTITCSANKTNECGSAWTFDEPAAISACSNVTITITGTVTNSACGSTFDATRTWQATDDCSTNVATCSQTVTVVDTTAPDVTTDQGADATIECPATPSFSAPVFTDACQGVITPSVSTVTNTVGCTNIVTRTWTANDGCGNSTNRSQVITVIDTTAPDVTTDQGADATVECPADFTAPVFTDACQGVITPSVVTMTNTIGCTNIMTRTWTADDGCGNSTNRSQVITVVDTTAAAVTTDQGADATIECPATPSFSAPVFTDACQGVITPSVSTVTNTVGCTNIVTRTWTADDGCGNSTNRSQIVTVIDTTAPAVTTDQGADATIECPATPSFSAPVFTDDCQGVITPSVSTVTNAVGCTNIVTRTWTANDGCGNSTNRSQAITVIDTTAPTITCATNKTVECGSAWTFDEPTASDNCCTNATISILSTVTNGTFCPMVVTRTWQATDCCNNSSTCTQTVTVAACPTITLTPGTLTNGMAGSAYSETIMATGSIAPYTFTVDSGSLPGGLSLASGGLLSGTATAGGTFNFDVVATAASGCTGTQSYSLTIDCPAISLDPTNLPNAVVGQTYNQTNTASGGTAPYTFSVNTNLPNGPLPPGLSLNETNGVLSGTPTATGTFPIEIVALDIYGCSGSQTHTVTVSCATIVLSPSSLPASAVGSNYNQTISASGGLPPYTFTNSGSLPAGLTLSSGGSLTGMPTSGGTNNFSITATDAAGCTGSSNYTIIITVPDGVAPGVTLSNPKTKSDVTSAVIAVDGKAVDASGIAQVLVRVNGGAYSLASLSGIFWTNSAVTLATGTNAINAKAIDNTGMEGTSKTNFVFLKVTNTFTLVQGGDGTATTLTGNQLSVPGGTEQPLLGTSILDIGRSYTLNIVPAPGSLFSNVLEVVNGTTNVLYTATGKETQKGNNKLPFTMKTNLMLIANIVTNRFVNSGGIYYGLYTEATTAHESSGWFTVKVDSKLKFSGKLLQQGEVVPFSGTFDLAGVGTPKPGKNIVRKVTDPNDILTLGLQLDLGTGVNLSGTVSSTNWGGAASMDADKSVDGAKIPLTLPPSVTNAFAMVMVGSTNAAALPAGDGYVLNFKGIDNAKGKFNAKGYTGEGAGVKLKTVTTGVFTNGSWPFYALLYKDTVNKKHYHGAMIGWLTINNGVTGDIVWTKKDSAGPVTPGVPYSGGFTTMFSSGGGTLLSSPVTNNAVPNSNLPGLASALTLTIQDGGYMPSPFVTNVTYSLGKITPKIASGIKVTIKTTAEAKGNVDPINKWVGVALQNSGTVRGAFSTGGATSGSVRLTP